MILPQILTTLSLLLSLTSSSPTSLPPNYIPVKNPNNITLTFGSYNSFWEEDKSTDIIFNKIANLNPDLWVWVGDSVILDIRNYPAKLCRSREECWHRVLITAKNSSSHVKLRESTRVIGTWNHHDYGKTKGGKTFKDKALIKNMWLDFMDEPRESPRRNRNGVYESYYLDTEERVKVILLDVRYNRDEKRYFTSGGTEVLGEEQWKWLEGELKENKAEYVVLGSGSQVLPDDRLIDDSWYSESRDRLLGLIRKYKVGGVVILSGDVQYGEIMKHPCKERVGFELYEVTSSGLTQSVLNRAPFADRFLGMLYPVTWNGKQDMYFDRNFGVLNFQFGEKKGIMVQIRNWYGKVELEKFVDAKELEFREDIIDEKSSCVLDEGKYERLWNHYKRLVLEGNLMIIIGMLGLLGGIGLVVFCVVLTVKGVIAGGRALKRLIGGREKVKAE